MINNEKFNQLKKLENDKTKLDLKNRDAKLASKIGLTVGSILGLGTSIYSYKMFESNQIFLNSHFYKTTEEIYSNINYPEIINASFNVGLANFAFSTILISTPFIIYYLVSNSLYKRNLKCYNEDNKEILEI